MSVAIKHHRSTYALPPQTPHHPHSFRTIITRLKRTKMAGYSPETVGLLIKSLSETATELADIERKK